MNSEPLKFFLIAGEPSGDLHGGKLIHAIKNIYPNPSNSSITISFSVLSSNTTADLSIKNILGQEVYKTSIKPASINGKWTWNGIQKNGFIAPSGNYFISISQSNEISTRKITLLK